MRGLVIAAFNVCAALFSRQLTGVSKASYNYAVSSFAAIDTMRNTLRRPKLEHVKSCGRNMAVGYFVCFSQAIVCSHGVPEDAKREHHCSRFTIRAWSGQCLLYSEDEDGTASVKVNLCVRKSKLPEGMSILPNGLLLVQTNLLYNLPLTMIRSVALVYHFQQLKHVCDNLPIMTRGGPIETA
jgi:hypothetical protein